MSPFEATTGLGAELRAARDRRDWSGQEAAERIADSLGGPFSWEELRDLELGHEAPGAEQFMAIKRVYRSALKRSASSLSASSPTEAPNEDPGAEPTEDEIAPFDALDLLPPRPTLDDALVWALKQTSAVASAAESVYGISARRLSAAMTRTASGRVDFGSPYDVLADTSLGPDGWATVWELVPASPKRSAAAAAAGRLLLSGGDVGAVRADLQRLAASSDAGSKLVAIALLAHDPASTLTLLEPWLRLDSPLAALHADIVVSIAAGLSEISASGDPTLADDYLRHMWRGPLIAGEPRARRHVDRLTKVVRSLGLRLARPDESPFAAGSDSHLEAMLGVVREAYEVRTIQPDRPEYLALANGDLQIVLHEVDDTVFAWVGRGGEGTLVGFTTEDPAAIGLSAPGSAHATALAAGWWVDLVLSARSGTRSRFFKGGRRGGADTFAIDGPQFDRQVDKVWQGERDPALPHFVNGHVRHYYDRFASEDAQARAPETIRRRLTPHDTWVRGYWTGGQDLQTPIRRRLGQNSALADVLGLFKRSGAW